MLTNKRILTIDDADTIRTYLKNLFVGRGGIVEGASTGEEGLVQCAAQHFDLILVDLFLPDLDGIEVLKKIRETNDISTIVMLTGHGGVSSATTAVKLGADGYIEKQNITTTTRDHTEFMYALEQAMDHRAGILAQIELDRMREDFYAMVTHDLRNPTGIIMMAGAQLIDEYAEPLTPQQQRLVTLIRDASTRLYSLINDYLDFAKINAGYLRLDIAHADLRQLTESSIEFTRLQAEIKNQTLTLNVPDSPLWAWVDAERLKQVIENLVSNAIKYTPEGGHITADLSTENEQVILKISDNGIGIDPAHIASLFAKYQRVPGKTAREVRGTGLGLLIIKEIVEAHHGTIEAFSEGVPGRGTTFTMRIPLHENENLAKSAYHDDALLRSTREPVNDLGEEDELMTIFIEEASHHIRMLRDVFAKLRRTSHEQELLEKARLAIHTLRGNAGTMQLGSVYDLATQIEQVVHLAVQGTMILDNNAIDTLSALLDETDDVIRTFKSPTN